jgi:hypothetical protein
MPLNMSDVSEFILDCMQKNGWWKWDVLSKKRINTFERPTVWDINCGDCQEWAVEAQSRYGGEVYWMDELDPKYGEDELNIAHAVLKHGEKYYDSQHPNGVFCLDALSIVKGIGREHYE